MTDSTVALTGIVNAATASAAVAAASGVEGVLGVDDQLMVMLDDELCTEAIQSLDR